MAIQLYANNAASTLASGITNVATSLTVASGQGALFPAPTGGDWFLLTLIGITAGAETSWEIVKCTARTTDALTIVRAQESTTAAAWAAGTKAELRLTAAGAALSATHAADTANPHAVTKTQVGLSNVDNTSDATERAATATLTNKTLTSPVVSSPAITGGTIYNPALTLIGVVAHTNTVSGDAVIGAGMNALALLPLSIPSGATLSVGIGSTLFVLSL